MSKPFSRFKSVLLVLSVLAGGCQNSAYRVTSVSTASPDGIHLASASGTGSGTGYEGRVIYLHVDYSHPCAELGSDGKPVPNAEINVSKSAAGNSAVLLRNDCVLLAQPKTLIVSDLKFSGDVAGTVTYQGKVFTPVGGPVVSLDFTLTPNLSSNLAWNRSSAATYFDASGKLATASPGVPRFAYEPISHQLSGLLMEGSSTNEVVYSEALGNAAWFSNGSGFLPNSAGIPAPDGNLTANLVADTSTNGYQGLQQNIVGTYTPGSTVSASFFVKAAGRTQVYLSVQDNVAWTNSICLKFDLRSVSVLATCSSGEGSGVTGSITPLVGGWYRIAMSGIPTTSYSALQFGIGLMNAGSMQYAGNGTGVYAWGAQLEFSQSSPSSYIPTQNASAHRASDSSQFTNLAWYNPASGTLFAEYEDLSSDARMPVNVLGFYQTAGSGSFLQNAISLADLGSSNACLVNSAGATVLQGTGALNSTGSVNRLALAYSSAGTVVSANGSAPAAGGTAGSLPAAAAYAYLGSQPDGSMRNRVIQRIQYFSTRLDNSALTQLTK